MPLDPPKSAQGQSKTGAAETPGAAEGQSAAEAPRAPAGDPGGIMFSGDLLFAGSIGRTDLPGGDYPTILRQPGAGLPDPAG